MCPLDQERKGRYSMTGPPVQRSLQALLLRFIQKQIHLAGVTCIFNQGVGGGGAELAMDKLCLFLEFSKADLA